MNLSKAFAFDEAVVRVVGTADKPLFVAADVCRILDIQNPRHAVSEFSEIEKGVSQIHTLGGTQEHLVVTEAGLYRLIFRSDKPAARKFQDWVFGEVLPEIRRTGKFGGEQKEELWEAYAKAKTGRVQMALLAAMGIAAQAAPCPGPEAPRRQPTPSQEDVLPLNLHEVWSDILDGLKCGKILPEIFRVYGGRRDELSFNLFLSRRQVATELAGYNGFKYRRADSKDFNAIFKLMPEYVPGDYRQRIKLTNSKRAAPVHAVWRFLVTESNPTLWAICQFLNQ